MTVIEHEGFTLADLDAMPDDGRRYELIGGSIVVNASPRPRHQVALGRLYEMVSAACPPGHTVFFAPMDLDLVHEQRVEPDLIVVPNSSIGEKRLSLPVLLLVEVISPSTAVWDVVAKRDAYEMSGVEHYWMLDTRKGHESFMALRLVDGSYQTVQETADRIEMTDPVQVSASVLELLTLPG